MNGTEPKKVEDGMVVRLDYTLRVEGEVVDTSEESEPIEFIQGQDQIIPGLERELYGMRVGDTRNVVISPQDAYGEIEPEAGMDIPRSEFPPEIPLEVGTGLQLRTQEGETVNAYIESVGPESVHLDFNHPLAGKELHFDVKVVDLRKATEDEIEHGHVHNGHENDGHEG